MKTKPVMGGGQKTALPVMCYTIDVVTDLFIQAGMDDRILRKSNCLDCEVILLICQLSAN